MSENVNPKNARLRAGLGAGLIVLLLVGAAIAIAVFWAPGAAAQPVAIYAVSENELMLVTLASAEAGERTTSEKDGGGSETMRWQQLDATAGAVLLDATPRLIATGDLSLAATNEIRLRFAEAAWLDANVAHTLHLPEPELRLRLGEPGAPGDALLLVFDADGSIIVEGGFFAFRAKVSQAAWTPGGASAGKAPDWTPRSTTLPPPAGAQPTPVVTQAATGNGAAPPPPVPDVGLLVVRFASDGVGLVERLDAELAKFGIAQADDVDKVMTRYQGEARMDLAAAGAEGVEVLRLQVPARSYGAVYLEWADAAAELIAGGELETTVPQPGLAVFSAFNVTRGGTTTITLTFGLEESLFLGPDGLEFRPVVTDFMVDDGDERDLLDPYPRQHRSGDDWMPDLGGTVTDALAEAGVDPDELADPDALRPEETDPESLAGALVDGILDESGGLLPGIPVAAG